ncbi:MAG: hypothetical protein RLZZ387_4690 [Chloroflexota bacterium]|jgi:hypothetical protein
MSVRGTGRQKGTMGTTGESTRDSTAARVTLALSGFRPHSGSWQALEQAFVRQPGVRYAYVCAETEMAYVVYDPTLVCPDQLVAAAAQAGFCAETPEPR